MKYETQENLDNESRVMNAIAEKYGLELHKCPERYRMDAVFSKDGQMMFFVEFKCRKGKSNDYRAYVVSLSKAMAAEALKKATGLPVYLVVEWDDMIGKIPMQNFRAVNVGGRTDRGDPNDFDLVAHYFVQDFETLDLF